MLWVELDSGELFNFGVARGVRMISGREGPVIVAEFLDYFCFDEHGPGYMVSSRRFHGPDVSRIVQAFDEHGLRLRLSIKCDA